MTAAIALRDVGKIFVRDDGGTVEVLGGLDLTIETGSFVTLVGRSGSGKSTILNMIAGLLDPSSGLMAVSTQDPYSIGFKAMELAVDAANGKDVKGKYEIPLALYTADKPDAVKAYLDKYRSLAKK